MNLLKLYRDGEQNWVLTVCEAKTKIIPVIQLGMRTQEIGREAGLRYVYAGNLPGYVGEYESTHCPKCNSLLVKRNGYFTEKNRLTEEWKCPKCGEKIAGLWRLDSSRS